MNLENCRYLYLKALRGHRALPYVPARDSLTHYRALPEAILAGRQGKGALAPFLHRQDNPRTLCQATFAA